MLKTQRKKPIRRRKKQRKLRRLQKKRLNEAFKYRTVKASEENAAGILAYVKCSSKRQSGSAAKRCFPAKYTQAKATQASKQNDAEKFFLNLLIVKIPALAKVSNSSKNEENKLDAESVKEPLKVTLALAAESNSVVKDDSITNFYQTSL